MNPPIQPSKIIGNLTTSIVCDVISRNAYSVAVKKTYIYPVITKDAKRVIRALGSFEITHSLDGASVLRVAPPLPLTLTRPTAPVRFYDRKLTVLTYTVERIAYNGRTIPAVCITKGGPRARNLPGWKYAYPPYRTTSVI